MSWFKLHTDIIDDVKISELSDEQFKIWVFLLAVLRENNCSNGNNEIDFIPLNLIEKLPWRLRISSEKISTTVDKLQNLKMIVKKEDQSIQVLNWAKRQYCESYNRVKKHRYSNVTKALQKTLQKPSCSVSVSVSGIKEKEESEKKKPDLLDPIQLLELYHCHANKLPKVKEFDDERKNKAKLRLKEHNKAEWWTEVFQKANASPFLTGENESGWKADFEWLVKNKKNSLKVLEGKYDQKGTADGNSDSWLDEQ